MTLPYKLALVLASMTLVWSLFWRVSGGEDVQGVGGALAREAVVDPGATRPDIAMKAPPKLDAASHLASDRSAGDTSAEAGEMSGGPAEPGAAGFGAAAGADVGGGAPGGVDGLLDSWAAPPTLTVGRDPSAKGSVSLAIGTDGVGAGVDPEEGEDTPAAGSELDGDALAGGPTTYTVKSGDTFEGIAKRELGGSARWVELAQANPLVDPMKLRVGQTLRLPGVITGGGTAEDESDAPAALAVGGLMNGGTDSAGRSLPPPPEPVTHVVRAGDSLSTIAARYYGDSTRWRAIFNANRDVLEDPHAVRAGVTLKIPPAVAASPKSASR